MARTESFSKEELQRVISQLHDSMYTLFYYPEDLTEEQIKQIKNDCPISDVYPTSMIPKGQMIVIQNTEFNPVVSMEFEEDILSKEYNCIWCGNDEDWKKLFKGE